MPRRTRQLCLLGALALVVTACGGGGGGEEAADPVAQVDPAAPADPAAAPEVPPIPVQLFPEPRPPVEVSVIPPKNTSPVVASVDAGAYDEDTALAASMVVVPEDFPDLDLHAEPLMTGPLTVTDVLAGPIDADTLAEAGWVAGYRMTMGTSDGGLIAADVNLLFDAPGAARYVSDLRTQLAAQFSDFDDDPVGLPAGAFTVLYGENGDGAGVGIMAVFARETAVAVLDFQGAEAASRAGQFANSALLRMYRVQAGEAPARDPYPPEVVIQLPSRDGPFEAVYERASTDGGRSTQHVVWEAADRVSCRSFSASAAVERLDWEMAIDGDVAHIWDAGTGGLVVVPTLSAAVDDRADACGSGVGWGLRTAFLANATEMGASTALGPGRAYRTADVAAGSWDDGLGGEGAMFTLYASNDGGLAGAHLDVPGSMVSLTVTRVGDVEPIRPLGGPVVPLQVEEDVSLTPVEPAPEPAATAESPDSESPGSESPADEGATDAPAEGAPEAPAEEPGAGDLEFTPAPEGGSA